MKYLGQFYRFELGKIWGKKIVWIAAAMGLFLTVISIAVNQFGGYYIDGRKVDTNRHMSQIYRADQEKLDGRPINQELLEEMSEGYGKVPADAVPYVSSEEYQTYARPYAAIFNFARQAMHITTSEMMEWKADEEELYQKRQQALEEGWEDRALTEGEKEFWREQEKKLEWPVTFRYKEGWWMLLDGVYTIALVALVVVAIGLAGVFPEEHSRRTDQLILSSKYGRTPLYLAKLLAGISFAATVALTFSGAAVLTACILYGLEGYDAACQLMLPTFSYPLSTGQCVLIVYAMMLFAVIFTGVSVMVLSELLRSSLGTLAAAMGVILLGMFVNVPEHYRVLSQIWGYLPNTFVTVWEIFSNYTIPLFGRFFTSWQAVPVIYLILGGAFAAAGRRRYVRCQVRGR